VFYLNNKILLPVPTFTSHVNEGIKITLYFISSISLVRHCCFYENMVWSMWNRDKHNMDAIRF